MRLARLLPLATVLLASQAFAADTVVDRPFDVAGFRQVDLRGSDNVVVRIGPRFSIVARGPAEAVKMVSAALQGDTVRIDRAGWSWRRTGTAVITVTLPVLTGASVSGSGDMTIAPFRTSRFIGAVAGSGDLTLVRIEAQDTSLSVSGSGNIKVTGHAGSSRLSIAGSGNLDAVGMDTATLSASIAGSGDLAARASGTASASVVGSGDIAIHGAAHCTVSKVGSGSVRCNLS